MSESSGTEEARPRREVDRALTAFGLEGKARALVLERAAAAGIGPDDPAVIQVAADVALLQHTAKALLGAKKAQEETEKIGKQLKEALIETRRIAEAIAREAARVAVEDIRIAARQEIEAAAAATRQEMVAAAEKLRDSRLVADVVKAGAWRRLGAAVGGGAVGAVIGAVLAAAVMWEGVALRWQWQSALLTETAAAIDTRAAQVAWVDSPTGRAALAADRGGWLGPLLACRLPGTRQTTDARGQVWCAAGEARWPLPQVR